MHSFLRISAIMDRMLILNRWDYPFMVAGQSQLHINILDNIDIRFDIYRQHDSSLIYK